MDRNCLGTRVSETLSSVALRKESVDRNNRRFGAINNTQVALRKESVDRNINAVVSYNIKETSLSARRAWIEMAPSLLLD